MKLKPEIKAQWVAALRSGEYQQTTEALSQVDDDGNWGYCCLGVLCELANLDGAVGDIVIANPLTKPAYKVYDNAYTVLPSTVYKWAVDADTVDMDYYHNEGNMRVPGSFHGAGRSGFLLSELNDGSKYNFVPKHTFAEIADLIEEHL